MRSVMAIGAIFGALNTMYSAVAERGREIATMRALGFGAAAVVISFLIEALLISFVGGALGACGCAAIERVYDQNDELADVCAYGVRVSDHTDIAVWAVLIFALVMGVLGGLPPAVRAAQRPIATALREL